MRQKLLSLLLLATAFTAQAQQEMTTLEDERQVKEPARVEFAPHMYLQLKGGVAHTIGETKFKDLLSPSAEVTLGYRFSQYVGLQLGASGWEGKGSWIYPRQNYGWKFVQGNLDVVLHLSEMVAGYNPDRFFNVYGFIGGGVNYTLEKDQPKALTMDADITPNYVKEDHDLLGLGRAGLGLSFRLSEHIAFNIEGNVNVLPDQFNWKYGNNPDFQYNALAGFTVKIGKVAHRTPAVYYEVVPVMEPLVEVQPAPEAAPAPEPNKVKVRVEPMSANVFFRIDRSEIRDSQRPVLEKLITYLKENPSTVVRLVGYADRQTGTPKYNAALSARRAEAVKTYLVSSGIAADRIETDYKGDTVQPFSTARENRVTICVAEDTNN